MPKRGPMPCREVPYQLQVWECCSPHRLSLWVKRQNFFSVWLIVPFYATVKFLLPMQQFMLASHEDLFFSSFFDPHMVLLCLCTADYKLLCSYLSMSLTKSPFCVFSFIILCIYIQMFLLYVVIYKFNFLKVFFFVWFFTNVIFYFQCHLNLCQDEDLNRIQS